MRVGRVRSGVRRLAVEFVGSPAEYWKIYMINLVLTVLTLGFYRPWAKVRQLKYLYNHLMIDGVPMDFTAKPVRLLVGQLLVLILFVVPMAYGQITLRFEVVMGVAALFMILFPVLLWLSYRFFFRYTVWSGVRMRFTAPISEFYLHTLLRALLSLPVVTVPLALRRWFQFVGEHVYWGRKSFSVNPPLDKLYTGWGLYIAVMVGALILVGLLSVLLALALYGVMSQSFGSGIQWSVLVLTLVIYLLILLAVFVGYGFLRGFTVHAIYDGIRIGEATLRLTITPWKLSAEYMKLYALTVFSLGLAYPYLFVRLLAMLANHAYLEVPEGRPFVTEADRDWDSEVSAIGVEALDDFGFDIDFDIGL